jgi:hypothetical protein
MQCVYRVIAYDAFRLKPPSSATHRTYWLAVPLGRSVLDTVSNVIADLYERNDRLDKFQLLGHGDFGSMTIGTLWDLESIGSMRYLKPWFQDMPFGIQLLGCGVASATSIQSGGQIVLGSFSISGNGYKLMREMARLTGVSVEAGIHVQVQDPWYDIEGPAVRVYPDGTYEHFVGASTT